MSVKLTPRKLQFVESATAMFGNGAIVSKDDLRSAAEEAGVPFPTWMKKQRVGYNEFELPTLNAGELQQAFPPATEEAAYIMPKLGSMNVETEGVTENLIPEKDNCLCRSASMIRSRRFLHLRCSTRRLLLVCLVMVKRFQ